MSEVKKIMLLIGILAMLCSAMFFIGRNHGVKLATSARIARVDTLVVYDTIVSDKPVFVEKKVTEKVLVPVHDTIRMNDTLYIYAEREQVHWNDSLSDVYASGIDVSVDSVMHYVPKVVITQEKDVIVKKNCRWGIGLHAGYGVTYADKVKMYPYVGVGISYNIISW